MAGRPLMPIGSHGVISPPKEVTPGVFEAFTRYRDADGKTRLVTRRGRSQNAATNNLREALTQRRANAGSTFTGQTRLREISAHVEQRWTDRAEAGDISPNTLTAYREALRLHILPALGELRLREITTGRCENWLVALRKRRSAEICRRSRTVLSGVLGYAARMEAIDVNPVMGVSPIVGQRKRKPRAMTRDERTQWLDWLDTHAAHDPKLKRRPGLWRNEQSTIANRALGDISRLMLATGCRIGEAMAISWDEVDLDARTVAICWHLIRVKGEGLVRMPGAKSEAGDRVLQLPRWGADMLLRRRVAGAGLPVFPDVIGGWRDPVQVQRWLRWSRDEAGFGWVTSHVYRQTVISHLDDAGLSTREVADQAGHSTIEQTNSYMARKIASPRAADALESLL